MGNLSKDEYVKFTCENKGKCCNIHHLKKYRYHKKSTENNVQVPIKSNSEPALELDFD